MRIGIAGLGTVGAGVVRLLTDNAALITGRAGQPITVAAVCARDRTRDRGLALDGVEWVHDPVQLATLPGLDAVVELVGGADGPALELVRTALGAGRPVVTANKALLAVHGATLPRTAPLAFEAAVAGGIPVIKALREGLAGNRITRVAGILNGTCNYILTAMREQKREFADVLAEAQALGYAEADPATDIDGIDAAHKLAILAALAFGHPVRLRRRVCGGYPPGQRARHRVRRGAGLPHQAAGHRAPHRRRGGDAGASLPGAGRRPDRAGGRRVQRGGGGGRRGRPGDAGGQGRRRRAHRLGRGGGPDRPGARPAHPRVGPGHPGRRPRGADRPASRRRTTCG